MNSETVKYLTELSWRLRCALYFIHCQTFHDIKLPHTPWQAAYNIIANEKQRVRCSSKRSISVF